MTPAPVPRDPVGALVADTALAGEMIDALKQVRATIPFLVRDIEYAITCLKRSDLLERLTLYAVLNELEAMRAAADAALRNTERAEPGGERE